jgi:hypothetical protein
LGLRWATTLDHDQLRHDPVMAVLGAKLAARRADELARSVEELRALGQVSQAVNSTLDLGTCCPASCRALSNSQAPTL